MRKSIRTNALAAFLGNGTSILGQWLILLVLTRFRSPEDVGEYSLALAIVAPVFMFSNLGLRSLCATDVGATVHTSTYAATRRFTSTLGIVTVAAAPFVLAEQSVYLTALALGLLRAVEAQSDIHHALLQRQERLRDVALSLAARSILVSAVVVALLINGYGVPVSLLAGALVALAVFLYLDRRLTRTYFLHPQPSGGIASLILSALPLGFVMLLSVLTTHTPKYFLASLDQRILGLYAPVAFVISGLSLGANAVGQATSPRFAGMFVQGDRDGFARLLFRLIAFAALLFLLLLVLGKFIAAPVLRLVHGSEYAEEGTVLLAMTAAGFALFRTFLGHAVTAARRIRPQPVFSLGGLFVATIASWYLVPQHGMRGAAAASAAASAFEALALGLLATHTIRTWRTSDGHPYPAPTLAERREPPSGGTCTGEAEPRRSGDVAPQRTEA